MEVFSVIQPPINNARTRESALGFFAKSPPSLCPHSLPQHRDARMTAQTAEELATQIEQQKLEEQKTEVRFRTHSSRTVRIRRGIAVA
jgi:hypothetical protein